MTTPLFDMIFLIKNINEGWKEVFFHLLTSNQEVDIQKLKQILVSNNIDVNKQYTPNTYSPKTETLLHAACKSGRLDTVQLLVELGANIEATGFMLRTPFLEASAKGHKKIVDYLADKGANVHVIDERGDTALHWAACEGHYETVELLIKLGVDVHAKCDYGFTALHEACDRHHEVAAETLVKDGGANVDELDNDGRTPLHLACMSGHYYAIVAMLELGADIEIMDKDGLKPMELIDEKNSYLRAAFASKT